MKHRPCSSKPTMKQKLEQQKRNEGESLSRLSQVGLRNRRVFASTFKPEGMYNDEYRAVLQDHIIG